MRKALSNTFLCSEGIKSIKKAFILNKINHKLWWWIRYLQKCS